LELRNPQTFLLLYPTENLIIGTELNERTILSLMLVKIN